MRVWTGLALCVEVQRWWQFDVVRLHVRTTKVAWHVVGLNVRATKVKPKHSSNKGDWPRLLVVVAERRKSRKGKWVVIIGHEIPEPGTAQSLTAL